MSDTNRLTGWDPAQYLQYAGLRLRPAVDLLARVPITTAKSIVDLGCGAGNVTRLLANRWPAAAITGVDSSPEMLARAADTVPEAAWVEADIGAWRPDGPVDLIFSNAALHWLEDHDKLFNSLLDCLGTAGILAVQMPRNFGAPSHTEMCAAALDGPWRAALEPLIRPAPVAPPEHYADLFRPRTAVLDIWETEYLQELTGDDPVLAWTRGTWLKPLLDALDEPDKSAFENNYAERLRDAYPQRADGVTLLPFRRLFVVAGV